MTLPETKQANLSDKTWHIGEAMARLSTGDLAMLRRGPLRTGEAGAPAFWLLAVNEQYGFDANEKWAAIIQAMALLTHRKPDGSGHVSPHNSKYRLGRALCDGGDKSWQGGPDARPALSGLRLARLLNSHGEGRRDQLLRAIRMLRRAGTPLNCADIAGFILVRPDDDKPARNIARSYYQRLDNAKTTD